MEVTALGAVAASTRLNTVALARVGIAVGAAVHSSANVTRARLSARARRQVKMVRLGRVAMLALNVVQTVALAVLLVAVERVVVLRATVIAVTS